MGKCIIDKKFYSALDDAYKTVNVRDLTVAKIAEVDKKSDSFLSAFIECNAVDETGSNLSEMRNNVLHYYSIFEDEGIMTDVVSYLNGISYYVHEGDYAEFYVYANAVKGKTGVYKEPVQMVIPEELKYTSSIFAAHEMAHMLKERNPKECEEFAYFGEVIPMLMELIIAYSYEYSNAQCVFKRRSDGIRSQSKSFKELYKYYKGLSDLEEKKLYVTAMNECGNYVNSFYYTLAFFALYIANKRFVLRLISYVLKGRCTTSDVIRYISEYDIDRLYESGLEEFNYAMK